MALYYIRVSHEVVEEAELEIVADSLEEAMTKARRPEALSYADWQLTDWVGNDQYELIDVKE